MDTNTTRSYKDLVVWQKGIALAKVIYQVTNRFPAEEKFGLVAQMRRQPFPFRRTLPGDKRDTRRANSFSLSPTQKAQ